MVRIAGVLGKRKRNAVQEMLKTLAQPRCDIYRTCLLEGSNYSLGILERRGTQTHVLNVDSTSKMREKDYF